MDFWIFDAVERATGLPRLTLVMSIPLDSHMRGELFEQFNETVKDRCNARGLSSRLYEFSIWVYNSDDPNRPRRPLTPCPTPSLCPQQKT